MRTTSFLIGAAALAGAGLVVAASGPQPPPGGATQTPAPAPTPAAPAPAVTVQPASPQPSGAQAQPAFTAEQKAVADAVAAFAEAYGKGDAAALGGMFSDDVVLIDPEGNETRGRAAVTAMYADAFRESPGLKLESEVAEVRFITPDVARVEGQSRLSVPGSDASEFNRFSALLVRKDGRWRAAEIREYATPEAEITPYERLKELEWMVGRWVDEGDENKVEAEVRWAENRSFLIRSYRVEIRGERASSGTMFIGWDPQGGQIKSWVFDSEGGHGEATWTRTGENQWVVKAQGVLHDGRPSSATLTHTVLTKDTVKTSSTDRIIGGRVAEDVLDVVMVRKPPLPAGAQPGPSATPPR